LIRNWRIPVCCHHAIHDWLLFLSLYSFIVLRQNVEHILLYHSVAGTLVSSLSLMHRCSPLISVLVII
jgi:hypothetical protein